MKITVKGIREVRRYYKQIVKDIKEEQNLSMKEVVEIGKFYAMANMPIKQDVPAGKTRMIELTTGHIIGTFNFPEKTIVQGEVASFTPGDTPYNLWIEEGSGDKYVNVWENQTYTLRPVNRGKTGFMKKTKSYLQRSIKTDFQKKVYKILSKNGVLTIK